MVRLSNWLDNSSSMEGSAFGLGIGEASTATAAVTRRMRENFILRYADGDCCFD